MIELGTKKGHLLLEIPPEVQTESVVGKVYQIQAQIQGSVSNPQQFFDILKAGFEQKFKAKLYYMGIDSGVINLQVEGSPFAWAAVIAWLPSIFTLVGVTLVGIAIFSIIGSIPAWTWGLLAIGVFVIVITPKVFPSTRR